MLSPIALISPEDAARALGLMGFLLYVTNYTCLSLRILSGESILYFAINTTAAMLVLTGLSVDFNLPAALIQTFFIVMGLIAIATRLKRRRDLIVQSV